jgi:tetratricopeptide (TPR) repeat protein
MAARIPGRVVRRFMPFAAAGLLAMVSCQSAPTDLFIRGAGEEEQLELSAAEIRMLELRLSPDPAAAASLKAELDKTAARAGLSRQLQARVNGLRAEAALLANEPTIAKALADGVAALSDSEEGPYYVRAALETDPDKRLKILDDGIKKAQAKFRLLCERGELLFNAGRYAEAAQDLDEGLRGLDVRYRELYGTDRDRAFALAQASRDSGAVKSPEQAAGLESGLTLRVMVEQAFTETRLISSLSSDPKPTFEGALPALKNAGLLLSSDALAGSPVSRKEAAYFFWGIVARMERNPKLLSRYRTKYAVSPVPDVPADAPWFDSVLGVVEREIMDLPDGVNFNPDDPVTGLEYLGMLAKLSRQYR